MPKNFSVRSHMQAQDEGDKVLALYPFGMDDENPLQIFRQVSTLRQSLNESLEKIRSKPLPEFLENNEKKAFFIKLIMIFVNQLQKVDRVHLICAATDDQFLRQDLKRNSDYKNFFETIAKYFDCAIWELALAYGQTYKINPEYCFSPFPSRDTYSEQFDPSAICKYENLFNEFSVDCITYRYRDADPLYDYNGTIKQTVLRYEGVDKNLYVYACRIGNSFVIGKKSPVNYLCDYTLLNNNTSAKILLVLNSDILFNLRQIYQESQIFERSNIIVTGIYGGCAAIDSIYANELLGHRVTIVVSPDCPEYRKLDYVIKLCKQKKSLEIKIYPYPIIGEKCYFNSNNFSENTIEKFKEKIIDFRDWERPSKMFEFIYENSISMNILEQWEEEYGIREKKQIKSSNKTAISCIPWYELDESENAEETGPLSMLSFFSPAYTTLIYGATNVGKSAFSIKLAISIVTGTSFIGLKASRPQKIIYLVGERGRFKARIKQFTQDLSPEQVELLNTEDTNFQIVTPDECRKFQENNAGFIDMLKEEKPALFIFDNLSSLAQKVWRGNNELFFDFIDNVKQIGISPILIHHTEKTNNTYLGSSTIGNLSQNIIRIDKSHKDLNEYGALNLDQDFLNQQDIHINVTIEKTKVAPLWENKSISLLLPNGGTWKQLTNWLDDTIKSDPISKTDTNLNTIMAKSEETINIDNVQLPPDERKVYEYMKQKPGGVRREEIDKAMCWGENKSLKVLKSLIKNNRVKISGESKATYYQLKSDNESVIG